MLGACARVGSPVGGAKDTLAPRFVSSNIDTSRVGVPTDLKQLRLNFDEYITLKDASKNLIISPPLKLKRILPTSMGNRYVLVEWEGDLLANTTYNFNFGNAIADLNEGNILPYYNFAFSTGDRLDDLYVSGEVFDGMLRRSENEKKETADKANYVVGLYQEKDTVDYAKKPYYIAKVDPDGYFELNYLSAGRYRLLAFNDENQNSVYDVGKEAVAFLKEPLELQKSLSGLDLRIFPVRKPLRYKEMKDMDGGAMLLFEGNPSRVEVKPLSEKLKTYNLIHHPKSDTVRLWFDAQAQDLGVSGSENLKFAYTADGKSGEASLFYRAGAVKEMTLANASGNLLPPNSALEIEANYPIAHLESAKWKLVEDSLTSRPFTVETLERNPFKIKIRSAFEIGKKYSLTIPKETVKSYYTGVGKSYQFNFEIDKAENYGILTLDLQHKPEAPFWVQLLSEKGDKVQFSKLSEEALVRFTELKPGRYQLRLLVDDNRNGHWDPTDFENKVEAEGVYVFPEIVEIRPLWENKEVWDLKTGSTSAPLKVESEVTPL